MLAIPDLPAYAQTARSAWSRVGVRPGAAEDTSPEVDGVPSEVTSEELAEADRQPVVGVVRPARHEELLGVWRLDVELMMADARKAEDFPQDPAVAAAIEEAMAATFGGMRITITSGTIDMWGQRRCSACT